MKKKNGYWTQQKILLEAKKHHSRSKFKRNGLGAYNAAKRLGIINEVYLIIGPSLIDPWTDSELKKEANKYASKLEFQRANRGAYMAARTRGQKFLDKICSHMKPHKSSPELELLNLVKNEFSDVIKFIDKNVKIKGKPYIKRFEIDIFVPSLKRGIEFDGLYWHSFDRMRSDKSKRYWSDRDIKNYCKIKDKWFKTNGISILHIAEQDWNQDKDTVIKKVFLFLKTGVK